MIDIIIPTYKNKDGLRTTLDSIDWNNNNFSITIIDDASNLDYSDIIVKYPNINQLVVLPQNGGPGMARQYGIDHTNNDYLLFIDTGDYFISKNLFNEIPTVIKENPTAKVFMWHFSDGTTNSSSANNHLHGKVYKRDFIITNNISFCPEGSYANEDIGFNRACRMILRQLERNENINYFKEIKKTLVFWPRTDPNSLTLRDGGIFSYTKQNLGLARNMIHVFNSIKVDEDIKLEEISEIISHLYFSFICTVLERPEYANESWAGAKLFYDVIYKDCNMPETLIQMRYSQVVTRLRKRFKTLPFPLNLRRFIIELEKFEKPPTHYLTFSKN